MTDPCPVPDCDGDIDYKMIGSAVEPEAKYYTTCGHSVYSCDECGEWNAGTPVHEKTEYHEAHTAGGGATGSYITFEYCAECASEVQE